MGIIGNTHGVNASNRPSTKNDAAFKPHKLPFASFAVRKSCSDIATGGAIPVLAHSAYGGDGGSSSFARAGTSRKLAEGCRCPTMMPVLLWI